VNAVKEKLTGMGRLFTKPLKFFDDAARRGRYVDGLIFMAFLALLIGIGAVAFDPTLPPTMIASDAGKVFIVLLISFVVLTAIWGVFAALIGLRLRPRVAAVLPFREAALRCLRVIPFALAPLALLFFHHPALLGLAALGMLALSVIAVSKALSLKILPALISQMLILGRIIGGGAMAIESFFNDPAVKERRPAIASHKLVGKPAPDIVIQPTGGTSIRLSELKGKVVILDFWAIWCPPCRIGLPMVSEVASKYKDRGVVFYAIGDGNTNQEKRYLEERKIDAIASSTNAEAFQAFLVTAIPQTVVIDKAGIVKAMHVGLSRYEKEELTSEIESALRQE